MTRSDNRQRGRWLQQRERLWKHMIGYWCQIWARKHTHTHFLAHHPVQTHWINLQASPADFSLLTCLALLHPILPCHMVAPGGHETRAGERKSRMLMGNIEKRHDIKQKVKEGGKKRKKVEEERERKQFLWRKSWSVALISETEIKYTLLWQHRERMGGK